MSVTVGVHNPSGASVVHYPTTITPYSSVCIVDSPSSRVSMYIKHRGEGPRATIELLRALVEVHDVTVQGFMNRAYDVWKEQHDHLPELP